MAFRPHWHAHPLEHFTMRHWHRGPSRLLWFILGAGASAWWIKHKECREYQVKHCMRSRLPPEAYPYPPPAQSQNQSPNQVQGSDQAQAQTQTQPQTQSPEDWHAAWHARKWEWSWPPKETHHGPSVVPVKPPESWEDETQRLQKMTQQATEAVSVFFSTR